MTYSRLATPRATRDVLAAHDRVTKKSLGQHFLVDDNIVGRIIDLADLSSEATVLEVGPGIGTLTLALCEAAGGVVTVERDAQLKPVLADTLSGCENVSVRYADALHVTAHDIAEPFGPPRALVANLPYGVAATLVLRYFEVLPDLEFAVVMVQAEVADRMVARPGTKAFGAYSVKLQLLASPIDRFPVSRSCFLPPPRVDSAVVRFERKTNVDAEETRIAAARLADIAFAQRRKTLRNTLKAGLTGGAQAADELLSSANIDGRRRAETLSVDEYLEMARISEKLGLLP